MKFPPFNSHNLDVELSLRPPSAAVDYSATELIMQQEEVSLPPQPETLDLSTPLSTTTNQIMHSSTSSRNSQSLRVRRPRARARVRVRAGASLSPSPGRAREPASPVVRRRRSRVELKNTPIKPPYPWSTEHQAVVHDLNYLRENQILTITGDVRCDRCEKQYTIEYDLMTKFEEIASFIEKNKATLHDRAPESWTNPNFLDCKLCGEENCVRPTIPEGDNKNINWLFLLLGQMIGRLKLEHLKYFCAYTNNHRTGAKNRLVYLTYLTLCKQLQPSMELFHR